MTDNTKSPEFEVPWRHGLVEFVQTGTGNGFEGYQVQPKFRYHHSKVIICDKKPLIKYYASELHHFENRFSQSKPTKYLNKYFPDLLKSQVETFVSECRALMPYELKIARTSDECEKVYLDGPNSCMSHPMDSGKFCSVVHPTRAYGDSDLGVAYVTINDRITARAIVWPDRMLYGRIYGDAEVLTKSLEAYGYKRGESFDGARMKFIPWDDGAVCPYLDLPDADYGTESDCGNWLILGISGDFATDSTNGCIPMEDSESYCEYGDHHVERDEITMIEDQSVCYGCENEYFFSCNDCGDMNHYDNAHSDPHDNSVCEGCYCDNYLACADCDDTINADEAQESKDGDSICTDCKDSEKEE